MDSQIQSRVHVIIVAGGQGTRMGTAIPKQFLELEGKPILYYTVKAFAAALPDADIILVLPAHQISLAQIVLQSFPERINITLVAGGNTRFHSVQNGLNALEISGDEDAIIMVHDGVRPLVSVELIQRCFRQAFANGSAIPALPVADSMRLVENEKSAPVDRHKLRVIQTPQAFRASILLPAMRQAYSDSFTDEATVVETFGGTVHLTEGERSNIKITTPEDLLIAEALLKARDIV